MLIPCHRSLYTGYSDHDPDCDLNEQTTSHITPSPSSVSSPTLENTSTTSGAQTSTLSMTEPTLQTTSSDSTTSSTEATEQHTTPTSTTTILQSTDSGEPSANTETSKQPTMDIHATSRPTPQHSKDGTGTDTDATILTANKSSPYKVAPEPTPTQHLTTIPPGELESSQACAFTLRPIRMVG